MKDTKPTLFSGDRPAPDSQNLDRACGGFAAHPRHACGQPGAPRQAIAAHSGMAVLTPFALPSAMLFQAEVDAQGGTPPANADLLTDTAPGMSKPVWDGPNLHLNDRSPARGVAVYERLQTARTSGDRRLVPDPLQVRLDISQAVSDDGPLQACAVPASADAGGASAGRRPPHPASRPIAHGWGPVGPLGEISLSRTPSGPQILPIANLPFDGTSRSEGPAKGVGVAAPVRLIKTTFKK